MALFINSDINSITDSCTEDNKTLHSADKCDNNSFNNHNNKLNTKKAFKFILVGDSGVGKTSIKHRYLEDIYQIDFKPTIGVDYEIKSVNLNNINYKISLWDTSGQERFRSVTKSYYNNADGVILCFDLTNKLSFINLIYWMENINMIANKVAVCLIGTKYDLEGNRKVSLREAKDYAEKLEAKYFEVSSMKNINVQDMFDYLLNEVIRLDKMKGNFEETEGYYKPKKLLKFDSEINIKKRKCC